MRISDWSSDVCSSDLVIPVAQIPASARHDDRHLITDPALTHGCAQFPNTRIGILRLQGIFCVRKAIMTARQPGILINHRGQPFRSLAIGAFPERPKSARSEEHTTELQSLMRISYAVFCLKQKNKQHQEQQ